MTSESAPPNVGGAATHNEARCSTLALANPEETWRLAAGLFRGVYSSRAVHQLAWF